MGENKRAYDVFMGIIAAIVALGLTPLTLALLACTAGLAWDFVQPPIGLKEVPRSMLGSAGMWFIPAVLCFWAPFAAAATLLWLFHRRMMAKYPALRD